MDINQDQTYRLIISCPDRVGIVAAVSQFVTEYSGWLLEASYHADQDTNWFFMRSEIKASSLSVDLETFQQAFSKLANEFSMSWELTQSLDRKKMVILASHASHCMADLLHRWHSGDLYCDIPCIISNHEKLRHMADWYEIPFHHVEMQDKVQANQEIKKLLGEHQADLVVLARYMQIIPPELCQAYAGKMINIHHSFLPSFVGANPYQRAFDRGVKLIGATCHYVTEDLDEGPIIEQDVVRVNHRHAKDDMVRLGKDVEAQVLSRGVRSHLEDRVIVHGNKTFIMD